MFKENLKKHIQNPDFIPDIYNYCDRWCERCQFTSRCMSFALSEEQNDGPEARDINNEIFWKRLSESFQATLDMLKEEAESEGIGLASDDIESAAEEEKQKDEVAANHECSRIAEAYGEMVDTWFDSAEGLFEEKEDELNLKVRLKIPDVNPVEEAGRLEDAIEVICWYQHQIYVKFVRAVRGYLDNEENEFRDDFPNDSNGSAKVALIAIDRSIAAWGEIRHCFPEQGDNILDLLAHLDKLRRKAEKVFPEARAFIRPGLDEL